MDKLLGQHSSLRIREIDEDGVWLVPVDDQDPDSPAVMIPPRELVAPRVGAVVEVFVHLDSDDRPVATTKEPLLSLGDVRFLEVTAVTDIGAFVDWGLGKELLVPFAQQSREVFVGEIHPIALYLDKSSRLAGSMHVNDYLGERSRRVVNDQWIEGEAWRNDPDIGLFVILERSYVGLVPASEPHSLRRGEATKFRVAEVLPDGKVVLSLRRPAHEEITNDAETIKTVLSRPGAPLVGDHSPPDTIRELFGLSKKAFKRAVGRLLKRGEITLDERNHVVVVRR
ncbi:S1-like domain-containing RNA-binding protein [soil metagenome]